MKELKLHRYALLIVPVLAFGGANTAEAHEGNNDSGAIHACVQKNNGQVRIVDADGSCRAKAETAEHWSIAQNGISLSKVAVAGAGAQNFPGPADFTYQDLTGATALVSLDGKNGTLVTIHFSAETQCAGRY